MNNNRYYACCRNNYDGLVLDGRKTCKEAYADLERMLKQYICDELVFIGVIKCSDNDPLSHIDDLV